MLKEFTIKTDKEGLYNITDNVAAVVDEAEIKEGIAIIYCPHTTGGITINENADPHVEYDLLLGLANAFPNRTSFKHAEGNSTAHLKSSCVSCSQTVIITKGKLLLGTWQGIFFCEFDGPRKRSYYVKVVSDV